MKLKYIINDLSSVLVEYYLSIRNIEVTDTKRKIMELHMKQAIDETFRYRFDPVDDVCSVDVWGWPSHHKYELGYDVIYDRKLVTEMIYDIRERLKDSLERTDHTIGNDDDVINIHDVPFEGFGITKGDILQLLDMDCK